MKTEVRKNEIGASERDGEQSDIGGPVEEWKSGLLLDSYAFRSHSWSLRRVVPGSSLLFPHHRLSVSLPIPRLRPLLAPRRPSLWRSLSLRSPSSGSAVRLHFMAIDAHHCPGSVMFMFRGEFGCFLYTGDFRWEKDNNAADEARNTLVGAISEFPVDILYLDNTYCNPIYSFPPRQVAALLVADIIASHPCHDFIIGIDSLGKEELLLLVSRILNIKIWVWPERLRTMHLLGHQDIFTTDTSRTRVRAVPRYSFSIQTLEGLNLMCPTIGIMPSGLPWVKRPFKGDDGNLSASLLTAARSSKHGGAIPVQRASQAAVHQFHEYMYSVHYSDHSCYEEIGELIKLVKPKSMKGIVASSSCYVEPPYYFGRICGASQPPELLPLRPDTTEQFRAVRIKSFSESGEAIVSKKEKRDGPSSFKRKNKRARIQVKRAIISELD